MSTYSLTELFEKRNELAGEILQIEKQASELRANLEHIEAAIRILRPGIDLPKIVAKHVEFRPRYFRHGELTRLCLDYIRKRASEPFTVFDVMPLATGGRALSHRDEEILRVTIHQTLVKIAKRGTIRRIEPNGRIVRWQVPDAG